MADFNQKEVNGEITKNLQDEIVDWAKEEFKNIKKEKKLNKNISLAFGNIGGKGEMFTIMLFPESIGSSSKGGCAFDNKEYNKDGKFKITREVKFLSLDGSKICNTCVSQNNKTETKVPRYQTACLFCKQSDFHIPKDSRWGISAKAHKDYYNDTYKLNEYILYISETNDDGNKINFKCFKILSSNEYFIKYIDNQFTNGVGNTCNFMPYSWDFYLSGPIILFDIDINEDGSINENFWNLSNNHTMNIPKSIIIKNKIYCSYNGIIPEEGLEYSEGIKFCVIKNKSLGKKRGTVTRK